MSLGEGSTADCPGQCRASKALSAHHSMSRTEGVPTFAARSSKMRLLIRCLTTL